MKDADFPVDVKPTADDGFGSLEGLLDDSSESAEKESPDQSLVEGEGSPEKQTVEMMLLLRN